MSKNAPVYLCKNATDIGCNFILHMLYMHNFNRRNRKSIRLENIEVQSYNRIKSNRKERYNNE